jgi:mediator of RNA polymerase II transcription subunit 12
LENKEKMVTSPDVINIEDDDLEPPAKRVKTEGHGFREDDGAVSDGEEKDTVDKIVAGSPLPTLRWMKSGIKRDVGSSRRRSAVDPAVRKSHGVEPPAVATRVPPPKKVLDFSPWTGNHPEDVLTETVVKNGYSDAPKNTNQSECNSAKASIWPSLSQKNRQGLSMLGYLFTAVIEKRQAMGRCTAPSTFKPPPRVTVTDTKREAWLRDLANPDVPLRKQSRTIPHGIRGKLLMEQCLSKAIPLQRAVWLAKCVGANELRAFRRKGVSGHAAASGEAKWVREWTVHVEQFLESVVGGCGQHEWQQKMNYAVKLGTAFFSEKLLEVDHYLDWIVTSLSEATLERLPIWTVLAQLYWKPITAYSKRGKALAEGILEHLHSITNAGLHVNAPLKEKLQKLVAVLAVNNRGCLISPYIWSKYKTLLSPKAESGSTSNSSAVNIARRNQRLATPLDRSAAANGCPRLNLYCKLDHVGLDVDIERLLASCQSAVPDPVNLVMALLKWASTPYRTGDARIYIASRLIAQLREAGIDTDSALLDFLRDTTDLSHSSASNVHRVVVDLVRLQAFSVGRYLQWLISSGVLSSGVRSCASSLLVALPTAGLPLHVLNTRKTMMRRLGYPVDTEVAVSKISTSIDTALARSSFDRVEDAGLVEGLTMSEQYDMVKHVCSRVATLAKDDGLSLETFTLARDIIGRVGDLVELANIISAASTSDNAVLLAAACDTVNYNAESLAALGMFKSLLDTLSEQYLVVRSQQPLDQTFILALTGLAQRLPESGSLVKLLSDDLLICEQQNSVAVCSPASDSLIGMQATSLESDSDIDAVFASGNTMDEQLMHRVFMRIMQCAAKPQSPGPGPVSRVGGWLTQLRAVDGSGVFDRIVLGYLRSSLKGTSDAGFAAPAVDALVATGSVQVSTVADITKEVANPQVAAHMLSLLLSDSVTESGLSYSEKYRVLLQRERCMADQPSSLNALFRAAAEFPELDINDRNIPCFIVRQDSQNLGSVRSLFDDGNLSDVSRLNAGRTVTAILQTEGSTMQTSGKLDLRMLVEMAGPLSVQYCVEAIKWMRSNANWTAEDDETLEAAILESFDKQSDVWPQLLEVAGDKVNVAMHERAQEQLLAIAEQEDGAKDENTNEHLRRCLSMLTITRSASCNSDSSVFIRTITANFKDLEGRLSELDPLEPDSKYLLINCKTRLYTLLQLCVMHVGEVHEESEGNIATRCRLLSVLCSLLIHPALQTYHDITEYIFDLASTLSNSLPDPPQGSERFPNSGKLPADSRLAFILGSNANAADSWLALASHQPPPLSQQQRVLSRQSSQHLQPQMSSRTSTTGQQSPSQPQAQHQRWPSQGGLTGSGRQDGRMPPEAKVTPYILRRWEIMPDPTPVMGENDASLSLGLFGARKV